LRQIATKVEYYRSRRKDHSLKAPNTYSNESAARGDTMATPNTTDWDAIMRDARFQRLHKRKTLFLWGLMALAVAYFFLLPIGAAYYQEVFKVRVWGVVNVGLLFALSEFVVTFAIAVFYSRKASRDFDRMAAELVADFANRIPAAPAGAIEPLDVVVGHGATP